MTHIDLRAELQSYAEPRERELVLAALNTVHGYVRRAAPLLGISERDLWSRIKRLGIDTAHVRQLNATTKSRGTTNSRDEISRCTCVGPCNCLKLGLQIVA